MAQEEVSKNREALKEALQSYEDKARALLLLPNGSQPARVRRVLLFCSAFLFRKSITGLDPFELRKKNTRFVSSLVAFVIPAMVMAMMMVMLMMVMAIFAR